MYVDVLLWGRLFLLLLARTYLYCNVKIRRAPLDEFHLDLLQLRRMR